MDITVKINCDNSAFGNDPGYELSRIFKELAEKVLYDEKYATILDINGNKVGELNSWD